MSHKNPQRPIFFLFISIGLLLTIGILYWYASLPNNTPAVIVEEEEEAHVFCTMEAKLCPDGVTYVGRSGPDCAFEACPAVFPERDADVISMTVGTETIYIPETVAYTYIHPDLWPPTLTVTSTPYTCVVGETVQEREIDGTLFCITTTSQGAAGSMFADFLYTYETVAQETATISFSLRTVQCLNYDMPEQADCLAEQDRFNADTLVALMR